MDRKIRGWLIAIGAVGLLAVGAYIGWFVGHLGRGIADDPAVWGQFGDYLGGFLNPLIAAAAFYWLTQSVRIQHRELADTKAELAKTAAAQTQQVRLLRETALLNALGSQLNSINSDIQAAREDSERHRVEIAAVDKDEEQRRFVAGFRVEPYDERRSTLIEGMGNCHRQIRLLSQSKKDLYDEIDRIRRQLTPLEPSGMGADPGVSTTA